jgi:hypothetical protein
MTAAVRVAVGEEAAGFALPGGQKHGHRRSGAGGVDAEAAQCLAPLHGRSWAVAATRCGFRAVIEMIGHELALRAADELPGS